jgi:hypothetical protein
MSCVGIMMATCSVGVSDGMGVHVEVGVSVTNGVRVGNGVSVGRNVLVGRGVLLGIGVSVAVGEGVTVSVGVLLGVAVHVAEGVSVGMTTRVGRTISSPCPLQATKIRGKIHAIIIRRYIMSLPQKIMTIKRLCFIIILLTLTACQQEETIILPTRVVIVIPTETPTPLPTLTHTPTYTLTPTITPSPTITNTPTIDPSAPTATPFTPSPTPYLTSTPYQMDFPPDIIIIPPAEEQAIVQPPIFQPQAPPVPVMLPDAFHYGRSVEGRDLYARRLGYGEQVIFLVGGIHGGYESNTTDLINQMIAHYTQNPSQILPTISLVLIPSANPDGASRGRTLEGRFNANGVDLNRNWGCGWEATAYFQSQVVSAGGAPFSEPETIALASLISDVRPSAVLFYHSAANGVYAGNCGGDGSSAILGQVLGVATGYNFGESFSAYPVTGTAPSWVDSLNIPSVDVELATASEAELERNIRGLTAIQCWLVGEGSGLFRQCAN